MFGDIVGGRDGGSLELHLGAIVAGKSCSHHHHQSTWQGTELRRVYGDTGMIETDRVVGAYVDTGVVEMDGVMGGYIFGRPWGR